MSPEYDALVHNKRGTSEGQDPFTSAFRITLLFECESLNQLACGDIHLGRPRAGGDLGYAAVFPIS
jgi:hypothetical protein